IDFTYYPQVSVVSGISEDRAQVQEVVRSYIEQTEPEGPDRSEIDALLAVKLVNRRIRCEARTLSEMIAEEGLDRIDLLKIDTENSEHLVLAGLAEGDWEKIERVIIEVHDLEGRLGRIVSELEGRGFGVYVEKEASLSKDAILYNVFGLRGAQGAGFGEPALAWRDRSAGWKDPQELTGELRSS
ncbi:FkbM family methyltransferase, partial [Flavitalea flava]